MNLSNHTAGISRLIKDGHTCLGVSTFAGMTLTGSDHNNSLLWSRESGSSNGKHYTWTPWGNGKPTAALPGFNGERTDPVSGAYHLGNGYRAYNPVLRRFNCPDNMSPFGAGGVNPYAYCAGDPVNHTDPSGHFSWTGILGIVTGAIGILFAGATAGASVAAAGGVMAAISSTSAAALVSGGLSVAGMATGVGSMATKQSNPEASSILGWVSLASGLLGSVGGYINRPRVRRSGLNNPHEYVRNRARRFAQNEERSQASRPARDTGPRRATYDYQQNQRRNGPPPRRHSTSAHEASGASTRNISETSNLPNNILRPTSNPRDNFNLLRSSSDSLVRDTIISYEGNLSTWVPENITRTERRRLLLSIHPDRHGDENLYTRATQILNNHYLLNSHYHETYV